MKRGMMYYFEQYSFLKPLFNYKLEKTQDSAMLGVIISLVSNFTLWFTGAFKSFSENFLGVGVAFIVMIFIIMIADFITGIFAAKKRKEDLESKKGLRWVVKFGSYILFVYILNAFSKEAALQSYEWLCYPLGIIKIYILAHITIWELKSIDENLASLGFDLRILKMIDPVFKAITKGLRSKASESGIEIPEEKEDKTNGDNA